MRRPEDQGDWAEQAPWMHPQGPYRDYGWDPGQSALPEFRDPTIHFMPYERERLAPWQRFHERRVIEPEDLPDRGWRSADWSHLGPYTGRGPRNYVRSDERLSEEICERMTRDGQLDASDINVEVKAGEVTLTGSVPDRRAKRRAEDISDSVYGVQDVHNQLQLQQRRGAPERWRDEVGGSGVYPVSAEREAPEDSQVQGMASWGQGERGAKG